MKTYGIFINHRHTHRYLAGRIYDFLDSRGMRPFLDAYGLYQGAFNDDLRQCIETAPYFLCLLTKGALNKLDPNSTYYKEIETAIDSSRKILVITDPAFKMPKNLPEKFRILDRLQRYTFDEKMENFYTTMEKLCVNDIHWDVLAPVTSWRERAVKAGRTLVTSRQFLESGICTKEARFGPELVRSVEAGERFTGTQRIKCIRMSCYAASIILTPSQHMLDRFAYDRKNMFHIFEELLQDEDFYLEIVMTAPGSVSAQDSIRNKKLGNSSTRDYPEAVFLGSYASVAQLVKEHPIFSLAAARQRFRFLVTDCVMPYALFQIIYKKPWEKSNHIKVDLYSADLVTTANRRSMLFFEADDRENYDFFSKQFDYFSDDAHSRELINAHHEEWIRQWEEYAVKYHLSEQPC